MVAVINNFSKFLNPFIFFYSELVNVVFNMPKGSYNCEGDLNVQGL